MFYLVSSDNFSYFIPQLSECVEHNDAILLVIVPAAQAPEISSSRALRIAKEYDSEGGNFVVLAYSN